MKKLIPVIIAALASVANAQDPGGSVVQPSATAWLPYLWNHDASLGFNSWGVTGVRPNIWTSEFNPGDYNSGYVFNPGGDGYGYLTPGIPSDIYLYPRFFDELRSVPGESMYSAFDPYGNTGTSLMGEAKVTRLLLQEVNETLLYIGRCIGYAIGIALVFLTKHAWTSAM